MLGLIINPDEFFAELKERGGSLKRPALIVLLLAAVISYYQYRLTLKLSTALPEDLANLFAAGAYINVVGSILGVFAAWVIVAAIMHGLSAFFDARGEFRRTFEFTGYGFLPSLFGSAITVPLSLRYIENAVLPEISAEELIADPGVLMRALMSQIPRDYISSILLLNVAVTLWSLVIWTFAVKNARSIELRKSLICAAVPSVIFCCYHIVSMLMLP